MWRPASGSGHSQRGLCRYRPTHLRSAIYEYSFKSAGMKKIIYCSLFLFAAAIVTLSFETFPASTSDKGKPVNVPRKDTFIYVQAFLYVSKVLMIPRCMICTPTVDA